MAPNELGGIYFSLDLMGLTYVEVVVYRRGTMFSPQNDVSANR